MEKGNAVVTTVSGAAGEAAGLGERALDVVVEVGSDVSGTLRDKVVDKGADATIESAGRRLRRSRDGQVADGSSPDDDGARP